MRALVLSALLFGAVAQADEPAPVTVPLAPSEGEPSPRVVPRATSHGRRVGRSFGGDGKRHKPPAAFLRGHCTLLESPLNPISGPCISVPLELKNAAGVSLGIARTSVQGDFDFSVDEDGPFTIAPSSRRYLLVSPTGKLHRGERVPLEIRENN